MKLIIMLFCIGLVIGCSSTPLDETSITQPVLLETYPLPTIPAKVDPLYFTLKMKMQIDEEGSVRQVKLINSIGDETWDSLATRAVMKWKFSPALAGNKPCKVWVNQKVAIRLDEPVYLSLAEILCDSFEDAQKVLADLDRGKDFGELASQISTAPSRIKKGVLGKVDIHCYSDEICRTLMRIKTNQYTQPMEYGQKYVIFKRIEDIQE